MSRLFSVSVLITVCIAVLAVGFGPGAAAAQAGNATDANGANATPSEENVTGTPVDDRLTLTGWSFVDGAFVLELHLEGDRPKQVTISESTQPGRGAQQFAIREERLLPGDTTIRMTTTVQGGHSALSITTEESIEAERGVVISTGSPSNRNPFRHFGGTSGLLSGVGITVVMSAIGAGWVIYSEDSGVVKA